MIQIVTDSMSDIRQSESRRYALTVLPQHVLFGSESYLDGVDLSVGAFYEKLAASPSLPKTSQVSPDAFAGAFESALRRGDQVICVAGSSKLSGNFQSASIARDMQGKNAPVYLVDSLNASLGQQALVWEAVRLRDAGESAPAIVSRLTALVGRVTLVGMVEDLRYLVMGGRLSAAKARLGATLNLKPMLRLVGGRVEQDGLTRGKRRAFEWFRAQLLATPRDTDFPLFLASGMAAEELKGLQAYLEEEGLTGGEVHLTEVGPVIGTHTGKGVLALSWIAAQGAGR